MLRASLMMSREHRRSSAWAVLPSTWRADAELRPDPGSRANSGMDRTRGPGTLTLESPATHQHVGFVWVPWCRNVAMNRRGNGRWTDTEPAVGSENTRDIHETTANFRWMWSWNSTASMETSTLIAWCPRLKFHHSCLEITMFLRGFYDLKRIVIFNPNGFNGFCSRLYSKVWKDGTALDSHRFAPQINGFSLVMIMFGWLG